MGEFVYLQTFQGKSFCAKMALSTWRVRPSQRASPHWRSILIRVPFYPLSALSKEELAWLNSLFGFFFKKRQKQQRFYIIKRFAKLTLLRAVLSLSGNFFILPQFDEIFSKIRKHRNKNIDVSNIMIAKLRWLDLNFGFWCRTIFHQIK